MDYLKTLTDAIYRNYCCKAVHVRTVPVQDIFEGKLEWDGEVEVFDLEGYQGTHRCYAWGEKDAVIRTMPNTRDTTKTPFPPPDDEITERLGRSIYYAQKLEKELKLVLLASDALGIITIDFRKEDWRHPEEFLSKKSLGEVIAVYRKSVRVEDKDFIAYLLRVKTARNRIAHELVRFYDPITRIGRDEVLKQLADDYLEVGNSFLIVRELRMLLEEKIGLTEEQLEARLKRSEE